MTCCPYGPLVAFPIVFGWIALALTMASTFTCHLINVQGADTLDQLRGLGPWTVQGDLPLEINGQVFSPITASLDVKNMSWHSVESSVVDGIDNLFVNRDVPSLSLSSNTDKCYSWKQFHATDSQLFDTEVHLSRAFSMVAVILGFLLALKLAFLACCPTRSFGWIGFVSIVEGIFTGLSLLMMESFYCKDAETCTMGHSGILCIVATVIWILVGIFLWCMPPTLRSSTTSTVAPDAYKV